MQELFYLLGVVSIGLSIWGTYAINKILKMGLFQVIAVAIVSCSIGFILIGIGYIISKQEENSNNLNSKVYEILNKINGQEEK